MIYKRCFDQAGVAALLAPAGGGIADQGYQGSTAWTLVKNKPGAGRSEADRDVNIQLSKILTIQVLPWDLAGVAA